MIVVLMGVAGSGKTTIGKQLANALECDFIDGDKLHPQANIDKMSQGIPLGDADRQPWLETMRSLIAHRLESNTNLVLACSALKAKYRSHLKQDCDQVRLVYLKAPEALLKERMERREGHFMPLTLLQSQLQTLEEPIDAIVVNVDQPVTHVVDQIHQALRP
ncbi:gluconokinase [Myxacorys almedinensis]|uniref:Gluconokinase n=1 Tax=Myxacorys almedinensis A TaxID=2690445 RepID=A0A8J8CGI6_9CYAN|nr:gluconokinase [Myxacorys almedinensis]NDJ15783.1 AAA family ATPase [Myxacorys almedinensis A]